MSEITVYGRQWCEDTNETTDELQQLGVPFDYVDIEADANAASYVRELNKGKEVTPTVIIRGEILVEPSREELGGVLRATGLMS